MRNTTEVAGVAEGRYKQTGAWARMAMAESLQFVEFANQLPESQSGKIHRVRTRRSSHGVEY